MQRQTILLIWIGGAVLAVALYLTGPDRFLAACLDLMDQASAAFHNLIFTLGAAVADVVRAAAIALYVVFVLLALLAAWRGLRSGWALVIVTAVVLLLVWRPLLPYPVPVDRWFAVLVLSALGAVVMSHRLLGPSSPRGTRRGPWPPFQPPQ